MEFMKAAGFKEATIDNEAFLVWSSEYPLEMLIQLCEALDLCEVIQLEIDRNVKVLLPSQAETVSLPPDFFRLSKEEILNEQKTKYVTLFLISMFILIILIINSEHRLLRMLKF